MYESHLLGLRAKKKVCAMSQLSLRSVSIGLLPVANALTPSAELRERSDGAPREALRHL